MNTADRSQRESSKQAEREISEDQRDNTILNIMFSGPSYPWTVDELIREVQDKEAADAVARLTEAGLVHRFGEFVFPTRTARRADELQVGANIGRQNVRRSAGR